MVNASSPGGRVKAHDMFTVNLLVHGILYKLKAQKQLDIKDMMCRHVNAQAQKKISSSCWSSHLVKVSMTNDQHKGHQ